MIFNTIWLLRGYIKPFLSPMKPPNCFSFRVPRLSFNLDLGAGTLPNSRHRPSPVLTRLPSLHARSLNKTLSLWSFNAKGWTPRSTGHMRKSWIIRGFPKVYWTYGCICHKIGINGRAVLHKRVMKIYTGLTWLWVESNAIIYHSAKFYN